MVFMPFIYVVLLSMYIELLLIGALFGYVVGLFFIVILAGLLLIKLKFSEQLTPEYVKSKVIDALKFFKVNPGSIIFAYWMNSEKKEKEKPNEPVNGEVIDDWFKTMSPRVENVKQ